MIPGSLGGALATGVVGFGDGNHVRAPSRFCQRGRRLVFLPTLSSKSSIIFDACILFNSLTPRPKSCCAIASISPLVELMIVNELEDQLLLALGAVPAIGSSSTMTGAVALAGGTMAIGSIRAVVHAVAGRIRHEPDFLDLAIHGILEQRVEPGAFGFDLAEVGQFRANGDGVLVRREIGQAQFLGVIGFEDDSHDGWFLSVWCGNANKARLLGRARPSRWLGFLPELDECQPGAGALEGSSATRDVNSS